MLAGLFHFNTTLVPSLPEARSKPRAIFASTAYARALTENPDVRSQSTPLHAAAGSSRGATQRRIRLQRNERLRGL
jgi:hypothetical protein